MASSKTKRQLNIQISADAHRVLRAIAFVDDARSVSGLAAPVIEEYAAKRSKETKVAKILRAGAV